MGGGGRHAILGYSCTYYSKNILVFTSSDPIGIILSSLISVLTVLLLLVVVIHVTIFKFNYHFLWGGGSQFPPPSSV